MQNERGGIKNGAGRPSVERWAFCILHSAFTRFHRDQRGGMLEYAMVFAFVAVPLVFLLEYMLEILSDYFGLIAYYVTWPFL
jgi:Flp pilus assembly pilin Flp